MLKDLMEKIGGRFVAIAVAIVLMATALMAFGGDDDQATVTAHFSRAVAIYSGSEVRLMGVPIGTVTQVVPEGDSVRVVMRYDEDYKLPADAKAAIVTPTLVADRFVQLAPAYTGGEILADKADIPLSRTGSPVELDRIYKSLTELGEALGPNGANSEGALNALLSSGADALRGKGALANEALLSMSEAVQTLGGSSDALFSSVRQLSEVTEVLARNDNVVHGFMSNLAGISVQLADQRQDLRQALVALSQVTKAVRAFVHENRAALTNNVQGLADVLGAVAKEQKALGEALQLAPLGLGNLAVGFDTKTGSEGSRIQFGPTGMSLGNVLCDIVVNARVPNAQLACQLLRRITGSATKATNVGAGIQPGARVGEGDSVVGLAGLLGVSP